MSDCYYDGAGCLVCPEQPAVAYVPARVVHSPVIGWNAGANSIGTIDGDLHAVFSMPVGLLGVIIGLKGSRAKQTLSTAIEHGLYFQSKGTTNVVQVIELGSTKTTAAVWQANDVFEIRRVNGVVSYLINDTLIYTSATKSAAWKIINCCLYAAGDSAPSGADD